MGVTDGDVGKPILSAGGTEIGTLADVTEEAIRFWPAYATAAAHESVSYEEAPGEDGTVEPEPEPP